MLLGLLSRQVKTRGLRVLRFRNDLVLEELPEVIQKIREVIRPNLSGTSFLLEPILDLRATLQTVSTVLLFYLNLAFPTFARIRPRSLAGASWIDVANPMRQSQQQN